MQVDIHVEDNDNYENEHDHIVDNSSLVSSQIIQSVLIFSI